MEGIEKIKTEKMGKKFRRKERGFQMEWVNSILAIPALSSAPYKHGRPHCRLRMAERYKTLKRKGIHGKAHERRTGVCKLPQFTAQMNQYRGIQVRFVE